LIFAQQALLPQGWANDVRIAVSDGTITQVTVNAAAQPTDTRTQTLLPALANVHSHSFQRAMAGMTEHRVAGQDSFWTWRDLMYRFTMRLTPEQIEAIAALAFMEMQEAGFASVGEFHYLHHQPDGVPYADSCELTVRIYAAAKFTGIGLTHLPVLYTYGGAAEQPLHTHQRRFGNKPEEFLRLLEAARARAIVLPSDTRVGIAPHSLRATNAVGLAEVLQSSDGQPVHMHIAEQPKEVADITAWLGATPVDWLLDNAPVGPDWCAIHATHMTNSETRRLALIGATAGLCPITEANLGDGAFNGPGWLSDNGRFGIGTDSNIRISMVEELRTLEYSQRLRDLARNVMSRGGSTGQNLYLGAACGGAHALGRSAGKIAPGYLADLAAVDHRHPALCALSPGQLLDGLVFASPNGVVTDVWSAGRHQVRQGQHISRDKIIAGWRDAVKTLTESL